MENKSEIIAEKEIDLLDLAKKLWNRRRLIFRVSFVGLIVGVVIAFSIPKEYATTVLLAPEATSGSNGNMGALAAITGVNLSGNSSSSDISMDIYPNIVESTPFLLGLANSRIINKQKGFDTTLYAYIKDNQNKAWWTAIFGLPRMLIGLFSSTDNSSVGEADKLELTKDQMEVIGNLKDRISILVDKKTGVITLDVTMQDPLVSASVADTLTSYLQSYIIQYRTEKARQDLVFAEQLYSEAKIDYTKAQQRYADYLDRNQNVILASYRVNQEKLQQEMALAYNVYTQIAQQLQLAKVKVQDVTPVYTIIQPAIIPLFPSNPNKKLIIIGFAFLFAVGASVYILGKGYLKKINL